MENNTEFLFQLENLHYGSSTIPNHPSTFMQWLLKIVFHIHKKTNLENVEEGIMLKTCSCLRLVAIYAPRLLHLYLSITSRNYFGNPGYYLYPEIIIEVTKYSTCGWCSLHQVMPCYEYPQRENSSNE